jgi:hypothetical protein
MLSTWGFWAVDGGAFDAVLGDQIGEGDFAFERTQGVSNLDH